MTPTSLSRPPHTEAALNTPVLARPPWPLPDGARPPTPALTRPVRRLGRVRTKDENTDDAPLVRRLGRVRTEGENTDDAPLVRRLGRVRTKDENTDDAPPVRRPGRVHTEGENTDDAHADGGAAAYERWRAHQRRGTRVRREGGVSGGVRPQRLARQQVPLLRPTDSAPDRGRIPPGAPPTHPRTEGAPPTTAGKPPRHRWNDRGASILEFAGFLPILLLIAMAAIQLGLVGYGISQAGSAARAAARAESLEPGAGAAAGVAAASAWLNPDPAVGPGTDTTTATVTVTVPSVIPLFDPVTVERSATMPNDNDNDNDN
ncbi:pilus assembly protein [Streptomyces sp. CA-210063]|uniref:TadE family protein n=1 Tax=Streptomyces sp. CA-210063 TaxID=2801029 RepID=UPI00214BE180|nr:TadE family protein [Streptomyces sp. CA-210063]UUU31198.1 pilus assembly protein [Streptomyces sp. CA-210063]